MKENLIGTQIEVLDNYGNVVKTITIKQVRELDNTFIVTDEDGNIYFEDELNWTYKLTPEYALYCILHKYNIDLSEWDYKVWQSIFKEYMNKLVELNYIKEA